MTHLTSIHDQLKYAYHTAWRSLWDEEPPTVTRADDEHVVIHTISGTHSKLHIDDFRARITDMRSWAEQAGIAA